MSGKSEDAEKTKETSKRGKQKIRSHEVLWRVICSALG